MNKLEILTLCPTKIEEDTDLSVFFCFTAVVQIHLQIHAVKQNRAYWSKFGTLQNTPKNFILRFAAQNESDPLNEMRGSRIYPLGRCDYNEIASEGQTPAHAPHSMHLSGSIT